MKDQSHDHAWPSCWTSDQHGSTAEQTFGVNGKQVAAHLLGQKLSVSGFGQPAALAAGHDVFDRTGQCQECSGCPVS